MPSTTERRARTISTLALVGIGALYAATAARHVLGGDNGELVAVGFSGGIAHPPGYPLYVLLLAAARVVPASSPAHAAALVTVAIATASVATLAWAARCWGASRTSALFAAALYAASPLAWILGTHAEVFALNVLVAMGIVGFSAPTRGAPLGREELRAFVLGLLAGLGLSNHHTIVLLAPIGLCAFVKSARAAGFRALVLGAVGLALGLTPYLSLMARAASLGAEEQACAWGNPRGWDGLLRHFLRRDYGTFSLGISNAEPAPAAHVTALAKTLFFDLCGAPLVLVVALFLVTQRRPRPRMGAWVALVASLVLSGPLFVARFNLPPSGIATHITERFHLLPLATCAVLLACSLDVLIDRFSFATKHVAVAAAALFVVRALVSYPEVREHHRPTTDLWVHDVLAIAPPHAIILHSGDDRVGAFLYARCALGLRPDVEAIAPVLLLTDWYPPRVSARLGIPVVHGEMLPGKERPELSARALVEQLVLTDRPVFVTDWFGSGLDRSVPSYPVGPLIRIVRTRREVPDPMTLVAMNDEAFAKIELEPTLPRLDTWAGARMLDYARPWATLANAFAEMGDEARAEACRRRARALTPTAP